MFEGRGLRVLKCVYNIRCRVEDIRAPPPPLDYVPLYSPLYWGIYREGRVEHLIVHRARHFLRRRHLDFVCGLAGEDGVAHVLRIRNHNLLGVHVWGLRFRA